MEPALSGLPPPGRWALGAEAQRLAEALLQAAQRQGLRTGWLAPEAGFLSNLSVAENLRLLHDWHHRDGASFAADLEQALARVSMPRPEWLQQRPAQLRARQLQQAGLLRVALLAPEVLVLHPASLAQAGSQLVAAFAQARLLLLAEPAPDWPAWPQPEPPVPAEGNPA